MNRLHRMEAVSVVLACAVIGGALIAGSCGCTQLEYRNPGGGAFYYWSSRDTSLAGNVKLNPDSGLFEWDGMNVSGQASPVVTANWSGFNEGLRAALGMVRTVIEAEASRQENEPERRAEELIEVLWRRLQAELDRRFPQGPPEPVKE